MNFMTACHSLSNLSINPYKKECSTRIELVFWWFHFTDGINGGMLIRSEQDKEPEQEAVSEVVGPVATAESSVVGMQLILQDP